MTRLLRVLLLAAVALHALPAQGYIGYVILSNVSQPGTLCHVLDMTPDGHYLAGACQQALGQPYKVTRWNGWSIEFLVPHPGSVALTYAISEDGEVATLSDPPFFSSFYGSPGAYTTFPPFGACKFWPVGVSRDLTRVVGGTSVSCAATNGNGALLWDNGTYVVPDLNASVATAISWDGSTVVGGSPAFRWDEGTVTQLTVPGPGESTLATGVSPDGSVVVGGYDATVGSGTDRRQVLWGPNGFMELGASDTMPSAATPADATGVPVAVVGDAGTLLGGGGLPTLWTQAFGLESLEARLQWANLPAQNLVSATGLSDDGRYVVGQTQIGSTPENSVSYGAIIPQWRNVSAAYFGPLDIDGYVRLHQPSIDPPERVAATVEFFGTTGGVFASGTTVAPLSDPFPLYQELGVAQANLVYVTDPLFVWTFEYDGSVDAPVHFTTQYPSNVVLPGDEATLFHWNTDTQSWDELTRLAGDVENRELTAEIPVEAFVPGERMHLAVGRTHAACADDLDNDQDGRADYDGVPDLGIPADPQCEGPFDPQEAQRCGVGPELALLVPVLWIARRRRLR